MSVGLQIGAVSCQPVSQLAPLPANKDGGTLAESRHSKVGWLSLLPNEMRNFLRSNVLKLIITIVLSCNGAQENFLQKPAHSISDSQPNDPKLMQSARKVEGAPSIGIALILNLAFC